MSLCSGRRCKGARRADVMAGCASLHRPACSDEFLQGATQSRAHNTRMLSWCYAASGSYSCAAGRAGVASSIGAAATENPCGRRSSSSNGSQHPRLRSGASTSSVPPAGSRHESPASSLRCHEAPLRTLASRGRSCRRNARCHSASFNVSFALARRGARMRM